MVNWIWSRLGFSFYFLLTTCVQVCYMGQDCSVGVGTVTSSGPGTRLKCAACSVVTHLACMDKVPERLRCKKTFIDGVRSYRDHQGETSMFN